MSTDSRTRRPLALALFLIAAGAVGWWASFALTLEKFVALNDPNAELGCDFSLLVQCGLNLQSWQGSIFGFPNPLLGIAGFVAPIAVGVALLARARFARWFWLLFNLGLAGALAFVIWLIAQSIFVIGTLCPWCMVVWVVTIPLFLAVTFENLATGRMPAPPRIRRTFRKATGWLPFITVACYLVVALIAQLRLDVLATLR